MRFSVVIPLYNKAPYIERAINSVLAQTVQDFEILVVDDGSSDSSAAIVRTYADERVKLIQQEHAGTAVARNRGISESQAELIAFLDGDDEWDVNFLEQISFLIETYPQAGLFATSYRIISNGEIQYPIIGNLNVDIGGHCILENYLIATIGHVPFNASSIVVRKKILQRVGCFPAGVTHGEDLDTWLRIYLDSSIAFVYVHAMSYFIGLPLGSADGWLPDNDFAPTTTAQKVIDSGLANAKLTEELYEYIAYYQLELAKILLFHGKNERARLQLHKIQKTKRYGYQKIFWQCLSVIPSWMASVAFQVKTLIQLIPKFFGSVANKRGSL